MKTNSVLKGLTVTVLLSLIFISSHAQTSLVIDTIKNTCVVEGESIEASDMLFKICDSTIMKLSTQDGSVTITTNLLSPTIKTDSINVRVIASDSIHFIGTALFDSIKIRKGFMQVDSIRARVIHVGDSSLVIGTNSFIPAGGGPVQGVNYIRTNVANQPISFGFGMPGTTGFSGNFRGVGIGKLFPLAMLGIGDEDSVPAGSSLRSLETLRLSMLRHPFCCNTILTSISL